jgi:transposase
MCLVHGRECAEPRDRDRETGREEGEETMKELDALKDVNGPFWVGLDVHKTSCTAVAVTEKDEKVATWVFSTTRAQLEEFAQGVPPGTPVALEASTTGKAVYHVLRDRPVHMGNPAELKAKMPKGRKTDAKDAYQLGHLLRVNDFPEAYAPPMEFEGIRDLVRFRMRLGQQVTGVKNRVHMLVSRNLLDEKMGEITDWFGAAGLETLATLPLSEQDRTFLATYLRQLAVIAEQEEWAEGKMARLASGRKEVELLMSIPGVDYYTALALIGEIGDISRFPDKKHFASYCGLAPKVSNSGEKVSEHLSAKRGNPVLKKFLCTAVRGAVRARKANAVAKFYRKKAKYLPGAKAEVAAGRKLSAVVYTILATKQPYEERDPDLVKRKTERLAGKAEEIPPPPEDLRAVVRELQGKGEVLERLNELVDEEDVS